uniref:Uncharacterized protein n=1 Tax=Salmonella phage vB_SEnST11_KE23 TaxID=3161174 RepID=A0AAU8GEK8_9CAUD
MRAKLANCQVFLSSKNLSMPCVAIQKIVTISNYFNALALPGIRSTTGLNKNC